MLCNIQRIIPSKYVLVIEIVMRNCMDPSKIELYSHSTRLSAVSVNLRQASVWLNETILNSGVGIYKVWDFKKYLNCPYHLKSDYLQGIYKWVSLKNNMLKISLNRNYWLKLNVVSGVDLCLGPNTVSLSVCLSNCTGD